MSNDTKQVTKADPSSEIKLTVHLGDAVSARELAAFDDLAAAQHMSRAEYMATVIRERLRDSELKPAV